MVLGSVLDWAVYRSLDLTVGTVWWLTKTTGTGLYNTGCYLTGYGYSNTDDETKMEIDQLEALKEQNKLLKEQNQLLRQISSSQMKMKTSQKKIKESPF